MENQPTEIVAPARHWPLFLAGVLLFVLGPVLYFAQMMLPRFDTPWYLPILSSLGVLLMAGSAWQRRGVLRIGGLVVFVLLCGLQWTFFLVLAKSPPYTGPAQVGQKMPPFAATYADGKAFTQSDLESGDRSAIIFFRGRW